MTVVVILLWLVQDDGMLQELILTVNILRNLLCGNERVKVRRVFPSLPSLSSFVSPHSLCYLLPHLSAFVCFSLPPPPTHPFLCAFNSEILLAELYELRQRKSEDRCYQCQPVDVLSSVHQYIYLCVWVI